MKSKLILAILVIASISFSSKLAAQSTQGFNYQGVARDASGDAMENTAISVRFRIRQGTAVGPIVYDETHNVNTDSRGLFTAVIGEGTVNSGIFANIDWGADDFYLVTLLNGFSIGTEVFKSVPYAKWAENGSLWNKNGVGVHVDTTDYVGVGTTLPQNPIDVQGLSNGFTHLVRAQVNHDSNVDTRALQGISQPAPGYGVGVYGSGGYIGLEGRLSSTAYSGAAYAISGFATGSAGTRYGVRGNVSLTGTSTGYGVFGISTGGENNYGVYGSAASGASNWAGYFNQNVMISNGDEASLTGNGFLQLGLSTGTNVVFDNNELTARVNGAASDLYLQPNQGNVTIGRTNSLGARLVVDDADGIGDVVRFQTGGSTKFRLFDNGGVIIGTSSTNAPTNGLYVSGNVKIGTTTEAAGYKVSVNGKVMCEELRVQNSTDWPDYVFAEDYERPALKDLSETIDELGHLPGVPSAQEVDDNGIMLGEMQHVLLEKIEELTLYMIEADEKISALEAELQQLKAKN